MTRKLHAFLVFDFGPRLDAEHRVVGPGIGGVDVVNVVRGDDLQVELFGKFEEAGDNLPLLGDTVVLDLDEVVFAAEDIDETRAGFPGFVLAVVEEVLGNERGKTAGEADESGGVFGEGIEIGARLVVEALEVGVGDKFEQVLVAG